MGLWEERKNVGVAYFLRFGLIENIEGLDHARYWAGSPPRLQIHSKRVVFGHNWLFVSSGRK